MHASTKWLIGEAVVIFVLMCVLTFLGFPMFLPYDVHKTLHIFGAVIFLGNIIVTGVWMLLAERGKERPVMHFAAKTVNWADVFFTAPGVFLLIANGFTMANQWGGFGASWVVTALILFSFSGIVWVAFLLPCQERMIGFSSLEEYDKKEAAFHRTLHIWYFWGIIATILPLMSLMLMVLKPKFW